MKNNRGFSLIEILVVVAIIGIISATSIKININNIDLAKRKSAEIVMQKIILGQTEYYSSEGIYFTTSKSSACVPNSLDSSNIELELFGGENVITDEIGYEMCVANDLSNFKIFATNGKCKITLNSLNVITRKGCNLV